MNNLFIIFTHANKFDDVLDNSTEITGEFNLQNPFLILYEGENSIRSNNFTEGKKILGIVSFDFNNEKNIEALNTLLLFIKNNIDNYDKVKVIHHKNESDVIKSFLNSSKNNHKFEIKEGTHTSKEHLYLAAINILKGWNLSNKNSDFIDENLKPVWFDYKLEASLEFLHKSNNSQKFESVNDNKKYELIKENVNDVLEKDSNIEFETKLIQIRDALLWGVV